jgi:hypothetical protein
MRLWTAAPPFGKWFGMLTILSLSKEGGKEGFYDPCPYYDETRINHGRLFEDKGEKSKSRKGRF